MTVTLRGDRGSFGGALTPPLASPLRLGALAARPVSTALLSLGANGDVVAGALAVGDMPLGSDWTWASGTTIAFATGPLAAPAATSRSLGTRLVLEAVPGSTEYAIGRDLNTQWTSVPAGMLHQWYQGATERLRLESDGTLKVVNGSGALHLAAAGTGLGNIVATGSLQFAAFGGGITYHSYAGQINPNEGYRENLGQINRKYLSLHAAELWVETLVAQQTLATIGGRILVGPTTTLTRDVAPGDVTIYVKHNAFALHVGGEEHGSKLVLEAGGKFEVMSVINTTTPPATGSGDYAFDVIRALAGTASAWFAGDAVFDSGMAKAPAGAFLDLYSVRGVNPGSTAGPTIVGNVRKGAGAVAWREHWAIGNLQGIYGNATRTFGAAFGDIQATHIQIDSTDGFTVRGVGSSGSPGQIMAGWNMAGVLTLGTAGGSQIVLDPNDGAVRLRSGGVDKIVLLASGVGLINQGLVLGSTPATTPYIRSAYATAWNAGQGFYLDAVADAGQGRALIGNSAGRRLQWDGASLKVISDGVTIDENGITMAQNAGTAVAPGYLIRFGTTGGYLWDSMPGAGECMLVRQNGNVSVVAPNGAVFLRAGGTAVSGIPETSHLLVASTRVELGGTTGGGYVPFWPSIDNGHDLGSVGRRWRNLYAWRAALFLSGTAVWLLELGADQAVKPTSSTWKLPSDLRAQDDVVGVDPAAALALVRRVPVIRYRYTGAFGTPAGERGIGVVAEDLEPLLPASVARRPDTGALHWDAHELFMLNVAAVQALAARVDALERNADR